jgi:hypothetical protein
VADDTDVSAGWSASSAGVHEQQPICSKREVSYETQRLIESIGRDSVDGTVRGRGLSTRCLCQVPRTDSEKKKGQAFDAEQVAK